MPRPLDTRGRLAGEADGCKPLGRSCGELSEHAVAAVACTQTPARTRERIELMMNGDLFFHSIIGILIVTVMSQFYDNEFEGISCGAT
jgi:hypothetical protein